MAEAQSYFSPDDPADGLFALPGDYVKDPLFALPDDEGDTGVGEEQATAAAPEPDSGVKQGGQMGSG